jgi:inhibitor of cysteine peptidase
MITLDEHSDGKAIDVPRGEELEIVLPANRTTGFRWRLESGAEPVLAGEGDHYEAPSDVVPGRGGTHRWRFRAEHAGRGTLNLELHRSWVATGAPARSFRVEVHVTEPAGAAATAR